MGTPLLLSRGIIWDLDWKPGCSRQKRVIVAWACLCRNWRWCNSGFRHKNSYCFSGL